MLLSIELASSGAHRTAQERKIFRRDRKWVLANPLRQHYVRRMIPGEFPEALPGEFWYAAVRQLRPGVRTRWGFKWFGDERPDGHLFDGEDAARFMFNFMRETAGRCVPFEEMKARMLAELPAKGRA